MWVQLCFAVLGCVVELGWAVLVVVSCLLLGFVNAVGSGVVFCAVPWAEGCCCSLLCGIVLGCVVLGWVVVGRGGVWFLGVSCGDVVV